jgi:hypothetical protein
VETTSRAAISNENNASPITKYRTDATVNCFENGKQTLRNLSIDIASIHNSELPTNQCLNTKNILQAALLRYVT